MRYNLVINNIFFFVAGQKDKPFVTDRENELRTPRPDLLDRPYAAEYGGESFRSQYKVLDQTSKDTYYLNILSFVQTLASNLNSIFDATKIKQMNSKSESDIERHPYTFATHWSTEHPSKKLTTQKSQVSSTQSTNLPKNAALHGRVESKSVQKESALHFSNIQNDLGVSASQDIRRSENENIFKNSIAAASVKPPSIHYTPPHLEPKYNANPKQSLVTQQLPIANSATTFTNKPTPSPTTKAYQTETSSTTARLINYSTEKISRAVDGRDSMVRGSTKFTSNKNKPTSEQFISEPNSIRQLSKPSPLNGKPHSAPLPINDLLPPFQQLPIYDDSTTQGPLIYSEWKIPSSGLLPPHREHVRNSNKGFTASNELLATKKQTPKPFSLISRPANGLEPPRFSAPSTEAPINSKLYSNPFLKSLFVQTTPSFPKNPDAFTTPKSIEEPRKSPTPRSITYDGSASDLELSSNHLQTRDKHYLELKKLLNIPDYTFPLETAVRNNYESTNSVNSFQIRIPDGFQRDANKTKPWYGENAKCPECHPSFVKPGTCEPCIKIRR